MCGVRKVSMTVKLLKTGSVVEKHLPQMQRELLNFGKNEKQKEESPYTHSIVAA